MNGYISVFFGDFWRYRPSCANFSRAFDPISRRIFVIKSWKEILLGVASLLAIVLLTTKKQWGVVNSRLMYVIALFAALHVIMVPIFFKGFEPAIAGLFINLRFLLFFVLVYIALRLYPQLSQLFIRVFVGGALVVMGFAVLQVTILPNDVLKYLGYGTSTIMPYMTVDQNESYVRINSMPVALTRLGCMR